MISKSEQVNHQNIYNAKVCGAEDFEWSYEAQSIIENMTTVSYCPDFDGLLDNMLEGTKQSYQMK